MLEARIPFLISSIADFRHHVPNGDNMVRGRGGGGRVRCYGRSRWEGGAEVGLES